MYRVEDAKVRDFYTPFYGHNVQDLSVALAAMRRRHDRVVWLAGDSSLDNKYWFEDVASALNGYEDFLTPQVMKKDVCYWINERCVAENKSMGCINTAVEATCLNDRAFGRLLAQDAFLRDNMAEEDVLVVSVGGNDVALQPLLCTALNLAALVCCTPAWCLERCACAHPPNLGVDCGCVGCGLPGCVVGDVHWMAAGVRVRRGPVQKPGGELRQTAVRQNQTAHCARVRHILPGGDHAGRVGGYRAESDVLRLQPGQVAASHS